MCYIKKGDRGLQVMQTYLRLFGDLLLLEQMKSIGSDLELHPQSISICAPVEVSYFTHLNHKPSG